MNLWVSSLGLAAALAATENVRPALETCIAAEAQKLQFSGVVSM